jgi:hypothetical protein
MEALKVALNPADVDNNDSKKNWKGSEGAGETSNGNGPIGVNLTLTEGTVTVDYRGFEITVEATQDVTLTKGTITLNFGPDGKISSITDVRGNKVNFYDKWLVDLTVGLMRPTEISFGKNSSFTFTSEFSGKINCYGRLMLYSATIADKTTGQAIKVSVGPNIDTRPPAPVRQRTPGGVPYVPPSVTFPIPLAI